jgi:hypothetical protein
MQALFSSNKAVRGEMLAKVIDAIFDFLGPRTYSNYMVQCEVVTHESYGVPREIFATFFGMVAETVEDVAGPDWTPDMAESWADLLRELDRFVQNQDQTALATS